MCLNFKVSLITGLISYITSLYLFKRNLGYDRYVALFIFTFSTVQWIEAIIWKNLNNIPVNRFMTSSMLPLVLALEVFVAAYAMNLFHTVHPSILFIYAIISILIFTSRKSTISTAGPNGLSWNANNNPFNGFIFLLLLMFPTMLYMEDVSLRNKFIISGFIVYALAVKYPNFGSKFCLNANAINVIGLTHI